MSVYEIALKRRSTRRFKDKAIPYEVLEKCVNAARLAPSGGNFQPVEYVIVDDKGMVDKIFNTELNWAASIPGGHVPPAGQRPTAYVIVLARTGIDERVEEWEKMNAGLGIENLLLVAEEEGVASLCIGGFEDAKIRPLLNVPKEYDIVLVVALGYPDESPVIDEFDKSEPYWRKIWRDDNNVIHVPKRKLADILHRNKF
jgi:nitroreductase